MAQPLLLLAHVNRALAHLREPALASLDEEGSRARRMRVWLDDDHLVAWLQRSFEFGFCKAECIPPREQPDARGRLKKRYRLPPDCLHVRGVEGLTVDDWDIASATLDPVAPDDQPALRVLVCNIDAPLVSYSRLITNPAGWDAMFGEVFALELAIRAAPSFGIGNDRIDQLESQRNAVVAPARRRSAQERAPQAFPTRGVPYLAARFTGFRRRF
ncbi:MAG: hypothetical protein J0L51_00060 [Rhizobiales bacterium]|nr:hypothetical protein [Hyphomicrobiales bacterium]